MPIPTFTGLKPYPEYQDLVNKINKIVSELQNLMVSLDTLNIIQLDADVVNAGTLNTNKVTIKAENGNRYYQINENGIEAFNGSIFTLLFDLATGNLSIAGIIEAIGGRIGGWSIEDNALYSSTTSYPRIVLDPTSNQIRYYFSAANFISISADTTGQYATIDFVKDGRVAQVGQSLSVFLLSTVLGQDMQLSSGGNLDMNANSGNVRFQNWEKVFNRQLNQSLSQALSAKVDKSTGTTGSVGPLQDMNGNPVTLHFGNGQLQFVT